MNGLLWLHISLMRSFRQNVGTNTIQKIDRLGYLAGDIVKDFSEMIWDSEKSDWFTIRYKIRFCKSRYFKQRTTWNQWRTLCCILNAARQSTQFCKYHTQCALSIPINKNALSIYTRIKRLFSFLRPDR